MRLRNRKAVVFGGLLAVVLVLVPARAGAFVGTGMHPLAVVLCNFSNQRSDAGRPYYYNQMYGSSGAGSGQYNLADYWHDQSFGQLSVAGTRVIDGPHADARGWYTVNKTRDQWNTGNREQKILDCENAALGDVDYRQFYGVVVVYPDAAGPLTTAIDATDTSVTVPNGSASPSSPSNSNPNSWPTTAPFNLQIDSEVAQVTALVDHLDGSETFTIVRGIAGTTAAPHNAGAIAYVPGELGAVGTGPVPVTLNDQQTYQLGQVLMVSDANLTLVAHETGHGFGFDHSRALTSSDTDYNDYTDNMSAAATYPYSTLGSTFGGSAGIAFNDKGPGLTSINLDAQGWIPASKHYLFDNSVPFRQRTITLQTTSQPDALAQAAPLQARIPASVLIQNSGPGVPGATNGAIQAPTIPPTCSPAPTFSCTTSLYYTVEYRQQANWDSGFPESAVVLHLLGGDGRAYWVNQSPSGAYVGGPSMMFEQGLLSANGRRGQYADPASKTYVAVNSISGQDARVTLGSSLITPQLSPVTHDLPVRFGESVTLRTLLTVDGAPVPGEPVNLSLGSQVCHATTGPGGRAACSFVDNQNPGPVHTRAGFGGDIAYRAASAEGTIVVQRILTGISIRVTPTELTAFAQPQHRDGAPTGYVTFEVDGQPVGKTKISSKFNTTLQYQLPPIGLHRITVTYSGDRFYEGSETSILASPGCSKAPDCLGGK